MSKQTLAPIGVLHGGGESGAAVARAGYVDFRRVEPRIHCDRQISILRPGADATSGEGAGGFITAQLTDCSLHGLGLMTSEALEVGEQFFARLKLDKLTLLVYTVRYCIPMKVDAFRVGAKFTGYAASSFQGDMGAVLTALTGGTAQPNSR